MGAEQVAGEAGEIVRGGEQSRVTGHAAQACRARIVHRAAQAIFGGGGAPRVGSERGIVHAQGLENLVPRVVGQGAMRHALDQLAEQDEAEVTVLVARARILGAREAGNGRNGCRVAVLVALQGVVRGQAARVREQLPRGDVRGAELRQPAPHGLVEGDGAAFRELQHGRRRGHGLGEACEIEHRVRRHRLLADDARSVGAAQQHAVLRADDDDAASDAPLGDGARDQRVDALGRCGGQRPRWRQRRRDEGDDDGPWTNQRMNRCLSRSVGQRRESKGEQRCAEPHVGQRRSVTRDSGSILSERLLDEVPSLLAAASAASYACS